MRLNSFMKKIYGPLFYFHTGLSCALAFTAAGAQFILTYYLGLIIDAVPAGHQRTIYYFKIIALALAVLIACSAFLALFSGRMRLRLSCRLQMKIGRKLCSAQYQDIELMKEGELHTIATKDVEGLESWLGTLCKTGSLPVQFGLGVLFVFLLNWKFALSTACLIPMAAIPEILISKKLGVYHAEEKEAYAGVISSFTEMVDLLLVMKAFGLERLFGQRNHEKLKKYQKVRMKRQLRELLVEVYGRCYGHITNPLLLLLGACFILAGEMSVGMVTSIMLLAGFVGEGLNLLNEVPVSFQAGRAGMAHIETLLELREEREDGGRCAAVSRKTVVSENIPIYEVRALDFRYGEKEVLKNLNFKIWKGEKIAITGPSGCGKTTLFKLLSGLYAPGEGKIFFHGKDMNSLAPEEVRENMAVASQETFLFHASFLDNIRVAAPKSTEEEAAGAGRHAQIDRFIRSFEKGYDTVINTTTQSVSNGQMQRINLARAFLKNADLLLLDEPTSALDPDTAGMVMDYLFTACADKTILMILHNTRELSRFDRVFRMEDGKIC